MSKLKWISEGGMFAIEIDPAAYSVMTDTCASKYPKETGGIIAGFYSRNGKVAYITRATSAPSDSKSGRTWFKRGIKALKTWLDVRWHRSEEYYVGEWHYHPNHSSEASAQDRDQLLTICMDEAYRCPEPILVIIGGSKTKGWELSTYIAKSPDIFMSLVKNTDSLESAP